MIHRDPSPPPNRPAPVDPVPPPRKVKKSKKKTSPQSNAGSNSGSAASVFCTPLSGSPNQTSVMEPDGPAQNTRSKKKHDETSL